MQVKHFGVLGVNFYNTAARTFTKSDLSRPYANPQRMVDTLVSRGACNDGTLPLLATKGGETTDSNKSSSIGNDPATTPFLCVFNDGRQYWFLVVWGPRHLGSSGCFPA